MIYVALLRGVNVGGRGIVSMATLKEQFEGLGLTQVKTYINSGNIIFSCDENDKAVLTKQIEAAIRTPELDIKVLLKTLSDMQKLVAKIPHDWTNNQESKCDVLFLWPEIDTPKVIEQIPQNSDIETLSYVPGAVLHHVSRENASKSRVTRIVGTPVYAQMTLRNVNTARKLLALMETLS
jgi:uncharacterized protein (DUF1697 family)